MNFDIQTIAKAIAGGIVSALVAEAARFGFHPQDTTVTAAGVIITAAVAYIMGHVAVYFAKNKPASGNVSIIGRVK
jgi:sugar phosphate permease